MPGSEKNELLCHAVKAIAYRFEKAMAGSKDNFGQFRINDQTRSVNEIIYHLHDLVLKTKTKLKEGHFDSPPPEYKDFRNQASQFLKGLHDLAENISTTEIDSDSSKRLLQGPLLDMVSHIGQIAMLNGINGNKVPKENYYAADINQIAKKIL